MAVLLVVVYHFFPALVPGGFVGVDVFFVISGYLITSLMLREVATSGRLSLVGFYARRVRRLLPAALAVTIGTLLLAQIVLSPVELRGALHDAAWTSVYLANWHFAQEPTGYFAQATPSPFLHFWSLAVEEQFYLLWPVIVLLVVVLARNRVVRALGGVLGVMFIGSLALSVVRTDQGSSLAYYSLTTRAWELALGSLLAVLVARGVVVRDRALAASSAVLGLVLVAAASVFFNESTPFPGWFALLPTAGAALVLWAGTALEAWPQRVLGARPIRYVGDISYSLYLWHWPVLVLGSAWLGERAGSRELACLAGLSVGLAALTYRLIETRGSSVLTRTPPHRVVTVGVVVALVSAVALVALAGRVPVSAGADAAQGVAPTRTFSADGGQITVVPRGPGPTPTMVPANASPALDVLADDLVTPSQCDDAAVRVCKGGAPDGDTVVALVGDSHAAQWWPAAERAARSQGWVVYLVSKQGCPLAGGEVGTGDADELAACRVWQDNALPVVEALDADLVIVANHTQRYLSQHDAEPEFAQRWQTGVGAILARLASEGPVLLVGQSPAFDVDPAVCLSENLEDISVCAAPLDAAVPPTVPGLNEELAETAGTLYFDPSLLVCSDTCPMMDQNFVMYRDAGHLSQTYSLHLSNEFGSVVDVALGATGGK